VVVTNGVITAITNNGGTSTKANGVYALVILDSLYVMVNGTTVRVGTGATGTYTVAGGVVTASAVTLGGVISPVPGELFFSSFKHVVNGQPIRDTNPIEQVRMYLSNPTYEGQRSGFDTGDFPSFFTEPWRNINFHNAVTSWDLNGQTSYSIQFQVSQAVGSPQLIGAVEYDNQRNAVPQANGSAKAFLQPVAYHQFSLNIPSGRSAVTILPIDNPIARIWFYCINTTTWARITPNNLTQLEVNQDNNFVLQTTISELQSLLSQYGFDTGIYDAAFVADIDQRLTNALSCAKSLTIWPTATAACTLVMVMETLPGKFS
jgi:hypothetical protein